MRVREVMSKPVVTVRPDTRLKQVADLLVTHAEAARLMLERRIKSIPIVQGRQVVDVRLAEE